jgi:hypothetical protein
LSQENKPDSLYLLKGQVVSSRTGGAVPFAHIINLSLKTGTYSDTLGYFRIWVRKNDILKITAVGYYDRNYFVKDWAGNIHLYVKITLIVRTYLLSKVDIKEKLTKEIIEYKIVHGDFKKDKIDIIKNNIVARGNTVDELKILYQSTRTGKIPLNFKSHADIQNVKLKALEERYLAEERIEKSARLITGLTGNELNKFILFCHIPVQFVKNLTDYELMVVLKRYFERYRKLRED